VVNQIAPADRRAEVVSSYFVVCYVGNSLPVIGVGLISSFSSTMAASAVFAGTIALFALAALVIAWRSRPSS